MSEAQNRPHFVLDASTWGGYEDGWNALATLLHFPSWHGRNANALLDSIEPGQINEVEAPYAITVVDAPTGVAEVSQFLRMLVDVVHAARERGADVDLTIL